MRRLLARELGLLALSLAVAALAGEAYFRLFNPQWLMSPAYTDRFGTEAFMANARIRFKTPDFDSVYLTNALGFRGPDRPGEKPAGTVRVVNLGPCFTWGYGINEGGTYSDWLEKDLNHYSRGPRFEVINLSPGGGDIGTHESIYRRIAEPLHPDIITLDVYFPTNLSRVAVSDQDALPPSAASLRWARIRRLVRWLPGYVYLCENSHLWSHLRMAMTAAALADEVPQAPDARLFDELQRVYIGNVDRWAAQACARGEKLLIFADKRHMTQYPLIEDHLRRKAAAGDCFGFVELGVGPRDVFDGDWHWNEEGHRSAARQLFGFLRRGWLKSKLENPAAQPHAFL